MSQRKSNDRGSIQHFMGQKTENKKTEQTMNPGLIPTEKITINIWAHNLFYSASLW